MFGNSFVFKNGDAAPLSNNLYFVNVLSLGNKVFFVVGIDGKKIQKDIASATGID